LEEGDEHGVLHSRRRYRAGLRSTIDLNRAAVNPRRAAAVAGLSAPTQAVRLKQVQKRVLPEMREAVTSASIAPNVVGGEDLVAKQSAVDAQGALRAVPIAGVVF
jgi:hypothetical protein